MAEQMVGLDTSVLLRLLTGSPEDQAERVLAVVHDAVRSGTSLVACDLALAETYHALHYHYELAKRDALRAILTLLDEGPVRAMPGSPIKDAIEQALASYMIPQTTPARDRHHATCAYFPGLAAVNLDALACHG